jgi:hypothetical protein
VTPEEPDRLAREKAKTELANSFFGRYSSILIPAAVSFAAVIVSLGQVWVTKISKDKELELVRAQKHLELELQDAQRKRELDISAAKFVTENREAIFRGTQYEQELFAKLISTLFPIEVSSPLLRRLQRASQLPHSRHGSRRLKLRQMQPLRSAQIGSASLQSTRV